MGISRARTCVKRREDKPLTLRSQHFVLAICALAFTFGASLTADARGFNRPSLRTAENLINTEGNPNTRPADQPLGRIEVYARGPYGEISAGAERGIMPSDLGRELKVGGVLFELKSMRSPDVKEPVLLVTIKAPGHTVTGSSRPAGTNRYILRENRKLVTLMGQSPGPLADIRVRFGKGTPTLPSTPKRLSSPTL
jgi:hypothetical protein